MSLPLGLEYKSATILNGASVTSDIALGAKALIGLEMPGSWTAANLTFRVSTDGGQNYSNLYDASGNEYTVTVAAGRYVYLDPGVFIGINMLQIRSGTSGSAVNQGADRIIKLAIRP
ncbi:hypothetical protein ACQR1Y_12145 [Bradyrhizobium sp. HKCCYLRH3099]|uniref:hypothetical protein n=1 Tax=unclassified Bradyrhizobium TaxID=2631580 RepID=UPI003EBA53AE